MSERGQEMSTIEWAALVLYPAGLFFLAAYVSDRRESALRSWLECYKKGSEEAHFRNLKLIGGLQEVVEHQDRLIVILWHKVYGTLPADDKGWKQPKSYFNLFPKWRLHRSGLEMVRVENYPWYQGILDTRWAPGLDHGIGES
jgi:hypothetical protein